MSNFCVTKADCRYIAPSSKVNTERKRMKKLFVTGLVVSVMATAVAFLPPTTHAFGGEYKAQIFANVQGEVVSIDGDVVIQDMSPAEVYGFVHDLNNDPLWYPGVLSSQLISGDGGPGTVYQESFYYNGYIVPIYATILDVTTNEEVWFTSNGVFTNLTRYSFIAQGDDTKFRIKSMVELPEGIPAAFMQDYMNLTFSNLLNALGAEGEITTNAPKPVTNL